MVTKIAADPRIDPRIKAMFGALTLPESPDVPDRETLLARANSEEAKARTAMIEGFLDQMDDEAVASSKGLTSRWESLVSAPDNNTIRIHFIRPDNSEIVPCVYYIHGGGMAYLSAERGFFKAWGRVIAAQGVAVAMIDFRNCVRASSVPEVAPYPAGLNDCVSGLKWVHANAATLGIDPRRIIIAGESGGGSLTLAAGMKLKRDGDIGLIKGLYAMCPYLAGRWPAPDCPSSVENNGILIDLHNNNGAIGYGIEAFNARDSLAWPGFAGESDVKRSAQRGDHCQRVRSSARRGGKLLSFAIARWRSRPLPPGDGHDPRHRGVPRPLPRYQPRHRARHGGLLQRVVCAAKQHRPAGNRYCISDRRPR